jgi:hypothetical protein
MISQSVIPLLKKSMKEVLLVIGLGSFKGFEIILLSFNPF